MVPAIARSDGTNYGAKIITLMLTCRKGSFRNAAVVIEMLRKAWGEVFHDPVWAIASNGHPKRLALYPLCMVRELTSDPDNRWLLSAVGNLPGLNLWTNCWR